MVSAADSLNAAPTRAPSTMAEPAVPPLRLTLPTATALAAHDPWNARPGADFHQ